MLKKGGADSGSGYFSYYTYKTGENKELIKSHAVADNSVAFEYVANVSALLNKLLGFRLEGNVIDLGANCKTRERRPASPRWPISELEFLSMEQPCISFHPENGLSVGLPLIHPEFCNWLLGCAIGIIPEYIRRILPGEGVVTGIDISEVGIEVACRDYPECSFLCQAADNLSNFSDGYADVIHGREFYPFTRTSDKDFQLECLKGYLSKLKAGGKLVLTMVSLKQGLCINWPEIKCELLTMGCSIMAKKMLIHRKLFRVFGELCYSKPLYIVLVAIQSLLERLLVGKNSYAYVLIKMKG